MGNGAFTQSTNCKERLLVIPSLSVYLSWKYANAEIIIVRENSSGDDDGDTVVGGGVFEVNLKIKQLQL